MTTLGKKCILCLAVLSWMGLTAMWLITLSGKGHCRVRREVVHSNATVSIHSPTTSAVYPWYTTVQGTMAGSLDEFTRYSSWINSVNDTQQENCTMVMMTYRRVEILPKILMHYCNVLQLQRIIVVWNDINSTIPMNVTDLTNSCRADLLFVMSEKNYLTNRYIPRKELETDCKYSHVIGYSYLVLSGSYFGAG